MPNVYVGSLFDLRYGDRLLWHGEWHAVANIGPTQAWLISLEKKDAVPFLAEESNCA